MTKPVSHIVRQIRQNTRPQDRAGPTDADLLGSFVECRDEAAFAILVRRHGPMVWGVCRRLLNRTDAEDAFQATFLVLVRKAGSVRPRVWVGNWLYGVARQTALQARRAMARRKAREREMPEISEPEARQPDGWQELRPLLELELSRLPDRYRAVIVLCDLEGNTRKQAARQLGCPEGTVAGRLARARALLAKRLARQGLAPSGAALAAGFARHAAYASVSASVVSATIELARRWILGHATQATPVTKLTEGVLQGMMLNQLRAFVLVLTATVSCLGAALLCRSPLAWAQEGSPAAQPAGAKPASGQDVRPNRPTTDGARPPRDPSHAPTTQPANGAEPAGDLERLQGVWKVTGVEVEGKAESTASLEATMATVSGNRITLHNKNGEPYDGPRRFELQTSGKVKRINVTGKDADDQIAMHCHYTLVGDDWRLCLDPNDTSEVERDPGRAAKGLPFMLLTLKKVQGKAEQEEAEQLRGAWEVIAHVERGEWKPEREGAVIVFNGNQVRGAFTGEFTLNAAQKPLRIDVIHRNPCDHEVKRFVGVYERDGDSLKFAFGRGEGGLPKEWKSTTENGVTLIVLKRLHLGQAGAK